MLKQVWIAFRDYCHEVMNQHNQHHHIEVRRNKYHIEDVTSYFIIPVQFTGAKLYASATQDNYWSTVIITDIPCSLVSSFSPRGINYFYYARNNLRYNSSWCVCQFTPVRFIRVTVVGNAGNSLSRLGYNIPDYGVLYVNVTSVCVNCHEYYGWGSDFFIVYFYGKNRYNCEEMQQILEPRIESIFSNESVSPIGEMKVELDRYHRPQCQITYTIDGKSGREYINDKLVAGLSKYEDFTFANDITDDEKAYLITSQAARSAGVPTERPPLPDLPSTDELDARFSVRNMSI